MKTLADSVAQLNGLIEQFRFFEALDKFYDTSVVVFENENKATSGFNEYRSAAQKFLDNVTNRNARLMNVIISDNMSVCEWRYEFDHKEWGHWDKVQISLQRWKNGKIVHERHHYQE